MTDEVCATEAARFGDRFRIHLSPVVEIRDRASHTQQLQSAACGEATLIDQLLPEIEC